MMRPDPEKDAVEVKYVHGYPTLAAFIASDPGHSTAIYRRFDFLSARNLLLLQSELVELEAQLRVLDQEDLRNDDDDEVNECSRDWNVFEEKARDANSGAEKRMKLSLLIRAKLKEYREAMVLESTMLSMRRPSNQAYEALHHTFWNKNKEHTPGGTFPMLEGNSANILEDKDDLVALRRPPEEDHLTKILRRYFSIFFSARKPGVNGRVGYISEPKIQVFVGAVNILLAAAFLFGAIYNLYYVQDPRKTLGLITGYTVAFALSIGLITSARRAEIFGACAAYAAVLVVFVSGNLGNNANGATTCCTQQSGSPTPTP